ncbi:hypothetical protein SSZBM1_134 [Synechococcus phage S-SZBM1]|uniref:Uncharacterized protein n=1 Tax=Synechococcus phage S-SZBM1 TaxID=2926475 RepID=A0AC61TSW9_9CAUD|nr:major head protein [Synechococcus phage S-SZBM1]UNH61251.1 hypothetical protein SSZBM1_134 [Synechococcus phage S-SZBM1]
MINEEAPTNSVGTGAETALPPTHEPGVTRLTRKGPKKKRRYELSTADMLQTEQAQSGYIPFRISYLDGQIDFIYYGKSEAQVRMELRKIYRPEIANKYSVSRLYPNQVMKYYWNKRQAATKGI